MYQADQNMYNLELQEMQVGQLIDQGELEHLLKKGDSTEEWAQKPVGEILEGENTPKQIKDRLRSPFFMIFTLKVLYSILPAYSHN